MVTTVRVTTIYNCSLERAYKTPMLCDLSKIHTGYGIMPRVTHTTNDNNWGQPGSSKRVFMAKSLTQKGGFASIDHILERIENQYWKIRVDHFQFWVLGFTKFIGEWKTTALETNKIYVEYTYHLHFKNALLYPICWIFAKTFWKRYMKKVLVNVKELAYQEEPYLHR